ncbi:FAD binding domain-containing protein, partial [Hyaloscypha bicolor E]
YFSQQQREVVPACVFLPASAEDVSQALRSIKEHQCHFAVKSGGHAMSAGASNAPQGITIDLRHLNRIELADDQLTTSVGAGTRWGEVYRRLEPLNLTAVGGRDSQIGAGGFVLGDEGISFTSRKRGWAFDNVKNFEVVLANGSISNISQTSHPDLYFALRGGGSNFGIVTRFDLETHQQGLFWGGHKFYLLSDIAERKKSMDIEYPYSRGDSDPSGQIILSFAFVPIFDVYLVCVNLMHGRPEPYPPVFKEFEAVKNIYSTTRITKMTGVVAEVDWMNKIGYRQSWATATFKISVPFLSKLVDIFIAETDTIKHVDGFLPSLILQIITKDEISAFRKHGGNALGISEDEGPLLLLNDAIRYSDPADDEKVHNANDRFMNRAVALAKVMGLDHRYIYQNYANQTQDVFAGLSPENKQRLLQIQKRHDPERVLSRLQPGAFRLQESADSTMKGRSGL